MSPNKRPKKLVVCVDLDDATRKMLYNYQTDLQNRFGLAKITQTNVLKRALKFASVWDDGQLSL